MAGGLHEPPGSSHCQRGVEKAFVYVINAGARAGAVHEVVALGICLRKPVPFEVARDSCNALTDALIPVDISIVQDGAVTAPRLVETVPRLPWRWQIKDSNPGRRRPTPLPTARVRGFDQSACDFDAVPI